MFGLMERRPWLPWVLAFGFTALVAGLAPVRFLISDDVGILRNLEQGFEVSFISMVLGKALIALYRMIPGDVPWYGLMLYLAHAVSLGLFLSAVVRLKSVRAVAGLFVPLYLAVYAGFLLRVSFNSASVMIGFNACLAWLAWTLGGSRPGPVRALGFGAALAASYLVRVDGFFVVMLLAAPLLFAGVWRTRPRWADRLLFLAPVAVAIALNTWVLREHVSPEYQAYSDYNRARGRFMDSPLSVANQDNLELMAINGWTANDYKCLTHWFFFDEDVFAKEKLKALMANPDVARAVPEAHFSRTLRIFFIRYRAYVWILLLVLAGPFLPGFRRTGGWPALYLLYVLALLLGIALVYQLPQRIGWPALLSAAGGMLFLHAVRGKPELPVAVPPAADGWPGRAGMAAVLLTTAGWIITAGATGMETRAAQRTLDESVAVIKSYPAETLFITEPALAVRWEHMSPLRMRRSLPENILPSGWTAFSPLFYSVIRRHGFESGQEILPSAVDNPRVLFILRNADFGDVITTYLADHAGRAARMERAGPLGASAAVYRLAGAGATGQKD